MYLGDLTEDATIDFHFTTRDFDTGAPQTLGGTPALSVYKANGTTQSTAGITLTADFDTVTGLNHVRIDTSADAFYATGNDYSVVITTGTVDTVSVVGEVVATFSIENRSVNVARWAGNDVTHGTGGPDVNVNAISDDTTAAANCESFFDGTGYAGTGNTIPTVTDITNQVTADMTAISGDATAADNCESFFDGTGYAGTGNTIPTVTDITNQVTADCTAISGDATAADNLEAAYDGTGYVDAYTELLAATTITGLNSQSDFDLTAGVTDDNMYNGCIAVITDQATGAQKTQVRIATSTASTNNVTLDSGTSTSFTVANGDFIAIYRDSGFDASTKEDIADQVWDEATSGHVAAGSTGERLQRLPDAAAGANGGVPTVDGSNFVAGIQGTKNTLDDLNDHDGTDVTLGANTITSTSVAASGGQAIADEVLQRQVTEGYAADGTAPTVEQALMMIQQMLGEFAVSGTTLTVKKLDGSTAAATFTLDDGSDPTSITRAT